MVLGSKDISLLIVVLFLAGLLQVETQGREEYICKESESELLYDWRFTANHSSWCQVS
jgi:hypothetical protein